MIRKSQLACLLLPAALLACPQVSRAGLWGRAKLDAAPAESPVTVDGRTADWPVTEPYEKSGLTFKAINDGENLYISISAHEKEAKEILSGEARQDVTVWFLDGKARVAGLRLPFGKLGASDGPAAQQPPEPEFLALNGVTVSTGPLPPNAEFDGEISSRAPGYEFKLPLGALKIADGKVLADFETAYASEELKRKMLEKLTAAAGHGAPGARPGGSEESFGQRGRPQGAPPQSGIGGGMGGGTMGGSRPLQEGTPPAGGPQGSGGAHGMGDAGPGQLQPELPNTISVKLSISLAAR